MKNLVLTEHNYVASTGLASLFKSLYKLSQYYQPKVSYSIPGNQEGPAIGHTDSSYWLGKPPVNLNSDEFYFILIFKTIFLTFH